MIRLRSALVLLPVLLLAGCLSLGGSKEPTDIYTLTMAPASGVKATPLNASIGVNVPQTTGLLDSRALLVSPATGQLQVYAGARWAERPARLVREQLLAALTEAGATQAIPAESGALTRYVLESDLDGFLALASGNSGRVRVTLQARLIDSDSRALIAQRRFNVEKSVSSMQAPALAAGLSAASSTLTREVAAWATQRLRQTNMTDTGAH